MKNTSPILNDINEYLVFVSQVKNLSENTTKSYERDLKKLYLFLEKLNQARQASDTRIGGHH